MKKQQNAVRNLISELQPQPFNASNRAVEEASLAKIGQLVAKAPLAVTTLDLSRFFGADARSLRAVFAPCANLKHLVLPPIVKPDNLAIMERGLKHCTNLESLTFRHYFDINPKELRARACQKL